MASKVSVSAIYVHVIEDVISQMHEEFESSGAGVNVLKELQAVWEMKMMHCGAISDTIDRPTIERRALPITPFHDLNVPYEGPMEEYETPTAEMLFPPTPLVQTPAQTPLPVMMDHGIYNIPTGPSDPSTNDVLNVVEPKSGSVSYMQPPSPWMNQRPPSVDVNAAYMEGRDEGDRVAAHKPSAQDFFMMSPGKRKRDDYAAAHLTSGSYMPQQDGSRDSDAMIEFDLPETRQAQRKLSIGSSEKPSVQTRVATKFIPQKDGIDDDYNDGNATEEYKDSRNVAPTPAAQPAAGDEEPPLNEDDDDEEDLEDIEQGEDEQYTQHLVLAQFDKVTRTKSRWKCTLKDGIMHLNGRDILFNKAMGEFDF